VASYNIKCAGCETKGELSWEARRAAVARTILGQKPDVIGIQEASQGNLKGSTLSQYDNLQALLGDPYRLTNAYRYNCATSTSSSSCSYVNRGASQSVRIIYNAETLELLASGSKLLAKVTSNDNKRYLAWAKLRQISTGKEFYFGTTHLQPNPAGKTTAYDSKYTPLRDTQAKQIRDELTRVNPNRLPIVLAGDFNSRWNSPAATAGTYRNGPYTIFTGAGYSDPLNSGSAAGRTLGPQPGMSRLDAEYYSANGYERKALRSANGSVGTNIDYILVSNARATAWATVVDVDKRTGEFVGIIPSDHNLIRADLDLG
jgi:Metal-dependent hydrolase